MVESECGINISYFHNGQIDKIEGIWEPTESERNAAWDMYVELVTRIPVAYIRPREKTLRLELASLYKLFDITREILRKYGPSVARPRCEGQISFGYLAVRILDLILRPFMVKWYPLLLDYDSTRIKTESAHEHEMKWERYDELVRALNEVRDVLIRYTNVLARASEVPSMMLEDAIKP
ncbi:MAG: hypothetical protein MUO26_04630 [Methanotrichaceae archaeon]|nr:hypothetical protein [Methanotrichaceae archaeon]